MLPETIESTPVVFPLFSAFSRQHSAIIILHETPNSLFLAGRRRRPGRGGGARRLIVLRFAGGVPPRRGDFRYGLQASWRSAVRRGWGEGRLRLLRRRQLARGEDVPGRVEDRRRTLYRERLDPRRGRGAPERGLGELGRQGDGVRQLAAPERPGRDPQLLEQPRPDGACGGRRRRPLALRDGDVRRPCPHGLHGRRPVRRQRTAARHRADPLPGRPHDA